MKCNRRGASLAELMILMSACVVILSLSAALVHRIMHVQAKTRRFLDAERVSNRLSTALRRDAHRADEAELLAGSDEPGGLLQLTLPSGQIVDYRQSEGRLRRTVREKEQTIAQEVFAFPAGSELRAEMLSETLVVLATASPAAATVDEALKVNPYAEAAHLRIEAALLRRAHRQASVEREEEAP